MDRVTVHLAKFAGAMRAHGVRVGVGDEIDAAAALTLVDLLDRAEVQRGLRIALKAPREAWAIFDRLFDAHWGGAVLPDVPVAPPGSPREHRGPMQWRWDGLRVRLVAPEAERPTGDRPGYSSDALLRRKPFDQISASELGPWSGC